MTADKLYENACENLRRVCDLADFEYDQVVRDPKPFAKTFPDLTAAIEIYIAAKDAVGRAKHGTAYNAMKRMVKSVNDHRADLKGVWIDAEGHQCACDGYRAVRLAKPLSGFENVKGMELAKVMPKNFQLGEPLPIPTPGQLKLDAKKFDGSSAKMYDWGDGLPAVNAAYLKDMMDLLPDAQAFMVGETRPTASIYFRSDRGDGLLLPIRKRDVA